MIWRFFALALVRLDFEKRWYLVTDRSLRVREGVVNVREMTIMFANIQNISDLARADPTPSRSCRCAGRHGRRRSESRRQERGRRESAHGELSRRQ